MGAKTTFRRLWSILLALVLVVGMMPTTALAEGETPTQATATADFSADPTAALVLLNAAKTGETDSTWDSDTNTLTLNGVNFETTAAVAVKLPAGSTIILAEGTTNTIKSGDLLNDSYYGIYTGANLTIQGTGTLDVNGGGATAVGNSYGIYVGNDGGAGFMTISGSTVTATSARVNGSNSNSIGIYVGKTLNISENANVTAISGGTNSEIYRDSMGIHAEWGDVTITNSTLTAISDKAPSYSYGICASNGSVTIANSIVTAKGGTAYASMGICSVIEFNSGTLIAESKEEWVLSRNQPNTLPESYWWRTSNSGPYNEAPGSAYTWNSSHNYVEFHDTNPGYVITFDANSGQGTMSDATDVLENYTLPANSFTAPAGMKFKCWSVNGVEKAVGETINVTANTTVKAIWEAEEYNVTVTDGEATVGESTDAISKAKAGATVTLTANAAPSGKKFDQWVVESESASISLTNANSATTTFTMPAGAVSVKATYATAVSSVAITGIDAPKSNTAFDTTASCTATGVSSTAPTVTWDTSESKAGYYKDYTASVTLTVAEGYKFTDDVTATVNGNPATSVTKNANGTLTVTYKFPETDKHNIEITVDTEIRDGDAAKNPTINSGYGFEFCFFVEDTDKDGVFIDETTGEAVLDDKTFVVDKTLVEKFAAQSEGSFTYESLMAALKREFGLDELKTEFTDGYDYSVFAYVYHIDRAYFAWDDEGKVTNAIVKVNGEDITDSCQREVGMFIMPGAYVFTTTKTYTVSFEANGGTGTMADVTGVSGTYALPANRFTAPADKKFKGWATSADGEVISGTTMDVAANTTLYAIWENIPVKEYDITVTDGKSTSSTGAEISQAAAGMTVTLTANAAPSGKVFDKWVVVSGNITLADANSATTTFTMPASAVSVKATYKNAPEPTSEPTPVPAEKGKVITDELGNSYKVTKSDAKDGEVTFAKPKSGVKGTVKISDTVTIDGITYKVTAIEANAFKNNKNITKVIIGNNVTVIGKNAFAGCKKLSSVTVGKKVKTISAGAFSGCAKLKTVKLGAAVTTIGDKAFYKCSSLTSITIPSKVTKIGKSAFEGCKKLKTITVKSTKLKSVGSRALKGIHANAKIKVPKSKLTKYKSLFKNKGQGKNVKVTK